MDDLARLFLYGTVQGVGFRPTVHRVATGMALPGYVRNNGANVEVCIPGGETEANAFLEALRKELPPLAQVTDFTIEEGEPDEEGFVIVPSSEGPRLSIIPPDTAICKKCMAEFHDQGDKRAKHPFLNCTDCGARFSVIRDLPYDRPLTSMAPFAMCSDCEEEYRDPRTRRFHAQTTNCPDCAPSYKLLDRQGKEIEGDPFEGFASRISEGGLGVMKGWGGMHIVCIPQVTDTLRQRYHRPAKPFAMLVRDIETAKGIADITPGEERALTDHVRPIVLVHKRDQETFKEVAPGLGNVGLMLPYTPSQMLLFEHLATDALVFTSANLPGEPIVITKEQALALDLDVYLLHDREIIQRADDSVVKVHGDRRMFIRRSRGAVPTPVDAGHQRSVLAVGAQLNVSAALTKEGKMFLTQYIGDSGKHPTQRFLGDAVGHFRRMFGIDGLEAVAADMHPRYSTLRIARRWAEEMDLPLVRVQHHHAHAASLLLDTGTEEAVVIAIDGLGYGPDGVLWGGEVLATDRTSYDRVAHLEELPMVGGEAAVLEPRRLVWAAHHLLGRTDWPQGMVQEEEARVWAQALDRAPRTTGMGRFLDLVSVYLGVAGAMSYDGEPAMRLEPLLERGGHRSDWEFRVHRTTSGKVAVLPVLETLFDLELGSEGDRADAAYGVVEAVVSGLADAASDVAEDRGVPVGVTGGVAYSLPILEMIASRVEGRGLQLLLHDRIPPGDGGISSGQALISGLGLD
jgi:hydrogenase maturation protein HypF